MTNTSKGAKPTAAQGTPPSAAAATQTVAASPAGAVHDEEQQPQQPLQGKAPATAPGAQYQQNSSATFLYVLQSTSHPVIKLNRDTIAKELRSIPICSSVKDASLDGPGGAGDSDLLKSAAGSEASPPPPPPPSSLLPAAVGGTGLGSGSVQNSTFYCREWASFVFKKWLSSLSPVPPPQNNYADGQGASGSKNKAAIPALKKGKAGKGKPGAGDEQSGGRDVAGSARTGHAAQADATAGDRRADAKNSRFLDPHSSRIVNGAIERTNKESVSELCMYFAKRLTEQVNHKKAQRTAGDSFAGNANGETCLGSLVSLATTHLDKETPAESGAKGKSGSADGPYFTVENVVEHLEQWIKNIPPSIAQPEMFLPITQFEDVSHFLNNPAGNDDAAKVLKMVRVDSRGQLHITRDDIQTLRSLTIHKSPCPHTRTESLFPPALEEHRTVVNEGIATTAAKCRATLMDEVEGVWKHLRKLMEYAPSMIRQYREMVDGGVAQAYRAFTESERARRADASILDKMTRAKDEQLPFDFAAAAAELIAAQERFINEVVRKQEAVFMKFFMDVETKLDEIMTEVREIILAKQHMFEAQNDKSRAEWCARVAQACLSPTGNLAGGTLWNLVTLGFQRAHLLIQEKHDAWVAELEEQAELWASAAASGDGAVDKLLGNKETRKTVKKIENRGEYFRTCFVAFLTNDLVAEEEILGRFIMLLNAVLCEGSFAEQQLMADYVHSLQETQQHISTRKEELLREYADGMHTGIRECSAVLSKVLLEEAVRLKDEDLAEEMQKELLRELEEEEQAKRGASGPSKKTAKKKNAKLRAKQNASGVDSVAGADPTADASLAATRQSPSGLGSQYMTPLSASLAATPLAGRSVDELPLSRDQHSVTVSNSSSLPVLHEESEGRAGTPQKMQSAEEAGDGEGLPASGRPDYLEAAVAAEKPGAPYRFHPEMLTPPADLESLRPTELHAICRALFADRKKLRASLTDLSTQHADLSSKYNQSHSLMQKAHALSEKRGAQLQELERKFAQMQQANDSLIEDSRNEVRVFQEKTMEQRTQMQDHIDALERQLRDREQALASMHAAAQKAAAVDVLAKKGQALAAATVGAGGSRPGSRENSAHSTGAKPAALKVEAAKSAASSPKQSPWALGPPGLVPSVSTASPVVAAAAGTAAAGNGNSKSSSTPPSSAYPRRHRQQTFTTPADALWGEPLSAGALGSGGSGGGGGGVGGGSGGGAMFRDAAPGSVGGESGAAAAAANPVFTSAMPFMFSGFAAPGAAKPRAPHAPGAPNVNGIIGTVPVAGSGAQRGPAQPPQLQQQQQATKAVRCANCGQVGHASSSCTNGCLYCDDPSHTSGQCDKGRAGW